MTLQACQGRLRFSEERFHALRPENARAITHEQHETLLSTR